jgi:hypothetical protein
MPELVRNLKKIIFLCKYRNKIYVEVGSAADPIREEPIFSKLIEEELQEKLF